MNIISIKGESVSKKFGTFTVFKKISFSISTGLSLAITGPNGSGKSTLLQIIAGLQRLSSGTILKSVDDRCISADVFSGLYGFTGPQVNPYDMLTAKENLSFTINGPDTEERINSMLDFFDLYTHRNKLVKYYSSGMKQRLKLIHALINEPDIIMLDEPCSNLDSSGKDKILTRLDSLKNKRLLIIASNEKDEINLCNDRIDLGKQNS